MLSAGTRLGKYEIISQLGAGGMGEVYLAHDNVLARRVALKVLPAAVVSDQDRMHRFFQEARAAASLNHPNIAHVYEVGEIQGTHFISLEYIDGQTLGELIQNGETNLPQLLKYLQHVAEAVAKAHAAGVVHRDLKPDNIMVSRDNHVKVLDFGYVQAHRYLGLTYEQEGRHGEALAALQRALVLVKQNTDMEAELGHALARSNKRVEAQRILDQLRALSRERFVSSYSVATIYAGLGERDQALASLEQAVKERSDLLVYIRLDPRFDQFHEDPRFIRIVQQIGLPPRRTFATTR